MSIRHYQGYWTIFVQNSPIISCASFQDAWAVVWEVSQELTR